MTAYDRVIARSEQRPGPLGPSERPCRVYLGYTNPKGYGVSSRGPDDPPGSRLAHVIVYDYEHPEDPPERRPPGFTVRHRCDNPPCNEGTHLIGGTAAENNADARARGRTVVAATNGQVAIARSMKLAGEHPRAIAARLGLSTAHVRRILTGAARVLPPGSSPGR